jgi:hypothetical protein
MTAYLLGTNHRHQVIGCPEGRYVEFSELLRREVREHRLQAIAEELNDEAIQLWQGTGSVARAVSQDLGIRHVYCDPTSTERLALGIPSLQELRTKFGYGRVLTHIQDEHLAAEQATYWPRREAHWLSCLKPLRTCNFLFVLGSSHMESFSKLLESEEIGYITLHTRWSGLRHLGV